VQVCVDVHHATVEAVYMHAHMQARTHVYWHARAGKDLLPNHLLPGYMGPDAPMSGLKGLSGIRVKEDDDMDPRALRRVGAPCARLWCTCVRVGNAARVQGAARVAVCV